MSKSWKNDLEQFMNQKNHFCRTEINEHIIEPALNDVVKEFNRFDDWSAEYTKVGNWLLEDYEREGKWVIYTLTVSVKTIPNYYVTFRVTITYQKGLLILEDISKRFKEKPNRKENICINEAMKLDYLSAIIANKFKNYYMEMLPEEKSFFDFDF